jgi:hypothetical protein
MSSRGLPVSTAKSTYVVYPERKGTHIVLTKAKVSASLGGKTLGDSRFRPFCLRLRYWHGCQN